MYYFPETKFEGNICSRGGMKRFKETHLSCYLPRLVYGHDVADVL